MASDGVKAVQAIIHKINTNERSVWLDIERFLVWWCVSMHDSVTWPRNGVYKCRTCGRHYAVPWAREERVSAPATAIHVLAEV